MPTGGSAISLRRLAGTGLREGTRWPIARYCSSSLDDPQIEARIDAPWLAQQFAAELSASTFAAAFLPVGFGEGAAYVGPEMFEAQREANRLVRERVEALPRLCDAQDGRSRPL